MTEREIEDFARSIAAKWDERDAQEAAKAERERELAKAQPAS